MQDLLLMTHGRIQEVLQVARDNYDCIASLSDAIALLDMCHCFADNVASSRLSWCRPVLSDRDRDSGQEHGSSRGGGGAIAIRNGRYAIDVSSTGVGSSSTNGDFVPNDTYSSALQNFTVITGVSLNAGCVLKTLSCVLLSCLTVSSSIDQWQRKVNVSEADCPYCDTSSLWKLCAC